MINDERLLASLIKRGKISSKASDAAKQKALEKYIEQKGKKVEDASAKDPLAPKVKAAESDKHQNFKDETKKSSGKLQGSTKHPEPVKESPSPGIAKKGKLLTINGRILGFCP